MKIKYFIIEKDKNKKLSKETTKTLETSISLVEFRHFDDEDNHQLYYKLFKNMNDDIDFVCIIPNGSTLNERYVEILSEYVDDTKNTIYLPLVLLTGTEDIKGILNSTAFNANFAIEFGTIDHELALQQTDTTIYGGLIPLKYLKDEIHYNKELKIYQHFHLLNSWSKDEKTTIKVIPKTLFELNYDLSYKQYNEEEKIENYKLARKKFLKEDIEETKEN